MKNTITFLIVIFSFINYSLQAQETYSLRIDDQYINLKADTTYTLTINNKPVELQLTEKDTLAFETDLFRFKHPKAMRVGKMQIDTGIEQFALMNADGSGILIQQYDSFDPTMLTGMMLNEVTKESVNYGFDLERQDYRRTLKSGQEVDVLKAVLTYKDETNIYEVAAYGKKDEGVLVMSIQMDDIITDESKKLIQMVWESLYYKK